ncbi:hypothetical protein D9619_010566 [Psilocybe cf. subviscida]|uniref:Uncharacterized protein n=1 Tax=Psilocybe cf. subviscida TaxID=2480587 RepID=A0A8H5ERM2_9AGAR|nr:hypothetical protein D9619_010566 [Psilocybe cf. subviscida]
MLLFLVLCAFLRTLQAASVPPFHASRPAATPDVFGVRVCRCPVSSSDDGGQRFRTVYDIVKSCLLTIFACVWRSAHPNINGPRDSWWTRMKRKVITMLCVLLAPEAMLLWALRQCMEAKRIAKEYNEEFAIAEKAEASLWEKVKDGFRPLPKATTRRGNGQPWTTTHGFFVQMGGFILYENEYPKEVLDYDRLKELLRDKAIDQPTVTERDLQDRSKGDAISKAIILLQTTWFVIQCIGRAGQHLPLSELEVLTLAFAVVNVAIYAVWWDKPQGVDMAMCVPLKEVGNSMPQADYHQSHMSADVPFIPRHEQQPDEDTNKRHSWLRGTVRKDHKQYNFFSFYLIHLPIRIVGSLLRPLSKVSASGLNLDQGTTRMPMFYADGWFSHGFLIVPCVFGTIFGAIHLIAWASEFPTSLDRLLWRSSTIVLTVAPFLIQFSAWMVGVVDADDYIFLFMYCCIGLIYVAARCAVIIIALLAIHHPPRDVLRDVSWTSHLPHF